MNKKSFCILMLSFTLVINSGCKNGLPDTDQPGFCAEGWGSLPIGGGGYVTGIITGQNTMYLRTDVGGAYRFENDKWVQMMFNISEEDRGLLCVEAIAIDPANDDIVYLLAGCEYFSNARTAIMKSTNGGRSFTTVDVSNLIRVHGNGDGRGNGERIAVDPTNSSIVYAGGRTGGLIKSTDGGSTWTMLTSLDVMDTHVNWPPWDSRTVMTTQNKNGISSVVVDRNGHVYVGVSKTGGTNVWVSADGGNTWSALSSSLPTDLYPQRVKPDPGGNILIVYSDGIANNGNRGAAFRYNITTSTLTDISVTHGGSRQPLGDISGVPGNSSRLVATTSGRWMPQRWEGSSETVYGDMIFTSTDGGASWRFVDLTGNRLRNGGVSWIPNRAIHWSSSIVINPQNHDQMLVTSGNGVFASDNIFASNPIVYFKPAGIEETVPLDFISVPGGYNYSVIGDYDGFIHRNLTDWAPVFNPSMGTTSGISYNPHNRNVLMRVRGYGSSGTRAYYSANAGQSWIAMNNLPNDVYGGKCAITTVNGNNRFIWSPSSSSSPNNTFFSDNNGQTWTACTGLPGDVFLQADSVNSNHVYAARNNMFYRSLDGGATFASFSLPGTGSDHTRITHVIGTAGKVFAPANNGLLVSTNANTANPTFSQVPGVTFAGAAGVGKAKDDFSPLTIYIWGRINNGVLGIHRSTDDGQTWIRINDNDHQFGGPGNGNFIVGDMNVFGRVYMSTVGLGIIYLNPEY